MKTRPFIIVAAAISMMAVFLFSCKSSKMSVDNDDIPHFLASFKKHIDNGDKDSLLLCFSADRRNPGFEKLINVLIDEKGTDGTILNVTLNIEDAIFSKNGTEITVAKIPVTFGYEQLREQPAKLTLSLTKVGPHQYSITEVDGRQFFTQLIAYQNYIKSQTLSDKDIYSPITLKAFETANELKAKYDSVIWFTHLKQQTYFYVVKGKWDMYQSIYEHVKTHKMGLVGPNQNEIIPADYDLIHNIGDVFENMVEVEQEGKKGFIDMTGKITVPVVYDNIFLIKDNENLAVLKQADDFYWLRNDFSISEKVELKMVDILPKLKQARSFTISNFGTPDNITEFNSREMHGSIYIPASYLVDMNLMPAIKCFENPIRKKVEFFNASTNYIVKEDVPVVDNGNWFTATFYNIRDYFLGGRAEFYDKKNLVIVDKRNNKIFATDINFSNEEMDENSVDPVCDMNSIKALNDTLFEAKTGGSFYTELYDTTKVIRGGTFFHYLTLQKDKLVELPNRRTFGFTKYVKMDDSYLTGCYLMRTNISQKYQGDKKRIDQLTPELLRYMKNEIYADYKYQFKDKRWKEVFAYLTGDYEEDYGEKAKVNANVDDSLTVIDRYNISFIDKKIKAMKPVSLAAK